MSIIVRIQLVGSLISGLTYQPSGSCGGGEDGPAVSAGASGAISDLTGSSRCQNVGKKSARHPNSGSERIKCKYTRNKGVG